MIAVQQRNDATDVPPQASTLRTKGRDADYTNTAELAPRGFFDTFTAIDILSREQKREFPAGLYLAYTMLESKTQPSGKSCRADRRQVPKLRSWWEGVLE